MESPWSCFDQCEFIVSLASDDSFSVINRSHSFHLTLISDIWNVSQIRRSTLWVVISMDYRSSSTSPQSSRVQPSDIKQRDWYWRYCAKTNTSNNALALIHCFIMFISLYACLCFLFLCLIKVFYKFNHVSTCKYLFIGLKDCGMAITCFNTHPLMEVIRHIIPNIPCIDKGVLIIFFPIFI